MMSKNGQISCLENQGMELKEKKLRKNVSGIYSDNKK
jgi:hypothetical protein